MSAEDGVSFHAGEVVRLVGMPETSGLNGVQVILMKNLNKDKWAVIIEGEDKRTKIVTTRNIEKLTSLAAPKKYCIVGTWDDWDVHEMEWNEPLGCFEYLVKRTDSATESFRFIVDGDWDKCVYPDCNDATPYVEHKIRGPDDGGSDVEWTMGKHVDDRGAKTRVRLAVYPDGRPKEVTWETFRDPAASQRSDNGAHLAEAAAVPKAAGMRTSVRDLLKKAPSPSVQQPEQQPVQHSTRPQPAQAPVPAREEQPASKRSLLPRGLSRPTARGGEGEEAKAPAQVEDAAPPVDKIDRPLGTILHEARPECNDAEVGIVKSKLRGLPINNGAELVQALRVGDLNERLKRSHYASMAPEWQEKLCAYFGVEYGSQGSIDKFNKSRVAAPQVEKPVAVQHPQRWEIVGGADTGGIMVRATSERSSEMLDERLSTGAIVEEIELVADRLHYRKLTGDGPLIGWITTALKGKVLAKRIEDTVEEEQKQAEDVEKKAPEPSRAAAGTAPVAFPRRFGPVGQVPTGQGSSAKPAEPSPQLKQRARDLDVHLEKLEQQDAEHVTELLDRLDRVNRTTVSKLVAQYAEMGFAVDPEDIMERAEMSRLVREALIWQEMKLEPLQEVCALRGIEVEMEQSREELLQLLVNSTWESMGIPITRIPDRNEARALLSQMRALENTGPNKLAAECSKLKLPMGAPAETLAGNLKQAYIWMHLSAPELIRECKAHSISLSNLSAASAREELYDKLRNCMWGNRCEARGIPASRLGSTVLADELLAKVDRFQSMGLVALKTEYRRMGITFDPKLDAQALVDRLRDMLIWESLPLEELQEDCRQRGLVHNDGRKAMLQRLRKRLDHELELEAQGLPVRRLGGYEAAIELVDQYEAIEQMSMDDLMEWYKGTGCPEERRITKDELIKLLKTMAVWEALPMAELMQECAQKKVDTKDLRELGSDEEKREFVATKLLQQDRLSTWEDCGFQAARIGNFQTVSNVVRQYNRFESMSDEDLERSYARQGLPKLPDMDRAAMLETLKTVLIWESLPLLELQGEVLERSDSIECDFQSKAHDNEQRSSLVRQLTVEILKSAYEQIGVPVDRIGYLEAYQVGKQLVGFPVMSEQELRAECEKLSLPATREMTCAQLASHLRSYTLWDVLPADDLWQECKKRGIHEQLREQILGLLLAKAFHD